MTTINLGKIKPLYKGAYTGAVTYRPLDFTLYFGNLYVCKAASTGNLPTDPAYFDPVTRIDSDKVSKTGDTMTGQLISKKSFVSGAYSSNFVAEAEGTAQGQAAGYSFRPTFVGTADNGPRRAADIWASFSGVWGTERLSFGVGTLVGGNDDLSRTIERLAITGEGNVLVTGGGGLGYGTGSGGTVTQTGSIGAGVALNKPSMTINLFRAEWWASEVREFFVSNSLVGPHDSVAVAMAETGISASWIACQILVPAVGGGFFIAARNVSGGTLTDTQVTLKAQLIKGSAS